MLCGVSDSFPHVPLSPYLLCRLEAPSWNKGSWDHFIVWPHLLNQLIKRLRNSWFLSGMLHFSARNISTCGVISSLGYCILETEEAWAIIYSPHTPLHRQHLHPKRAKGHKRWWARSMTQFSCLVIQCPTFSVSLEIVVWVLINSKIHFKGLWLLTNKYLFSSLHAVILVLRHMGVFPNF